MERDEKMESTKYGKPWESPSGMDTPAEAQYQQWQAVINVPTASPPSHRAPSLCAAPSPNLPPPCTCSPDTLTSTWLIGSLHQSPTSPRCKNPPPQSHPLILPILCKTFEEIPGTTHTHTHTLVHTHETKSSRHTLTGIYTYLCTLTYTYNAAIKHKCADADTYKHANS